MWSLVVRTLLQVILSIRYIFVVLFLVVMGFTCSYLVLVGSSFQDGDDDNFFRNPLVASLSTTLFVFGEYGSLESFLLLDDWREGGGLAMILLVVLLIIVVLLLLNVVIAKMGDTYAEVRDRAILESRLEIAKIIEELEQSSKKRFFPWLHSLQPVKSHLLEEHETKEVQLIQKLSDDFQDKLLEISQRIHDLSTSTMTQYETLRNEIMAVKNGEHQNHSRASSISS